MSANADAQSAEDGFERECISLSAKDRPSAKGEVCSAKVLQ
jgi:hypothetical protein